MNKHNQPKKAKRLFTLWLILFFAFSIGSSFYVSYQEVFYGNDPTALLSGFQLFTLAIILVFFIPLLLYVFRLAKQSNQQKICKVTYGLLWLLGIWTCFMVLSTVLALVVPGIFAQ